MQNGSKIVTAHIKSKYLEQLKGDLVVTFKAPNLQFAVHFFMSISLITTLVLGVAVYVFSSKFY